MNEFYITYIVSYGIVLVWLIGVSWFALWFSYQIYIAKKEGRIK